MKKTLAALAPLFALVACGGGGGPVSVQNATIDVQPGAVPITVNCTGCTIQYPAPASSPAPSPTPSPSPAPSPSPSPSPAPDVPLATVRRSSTDPMLTAGDVHWTSQGVSYVIKVGDAAGAAQFATLWKCSLGCDVGGLPSAWSVVTQLDPQLDLELPGLGDKSDNGYLQLMSVTVLPALNAWLTSQPSAATLAPQSKQAIPASVTGLDRYAALLGEHLSIDFSKTPPVASLK